MEGGASPCLERMAFVSQTTKRALEASLKKLLLQKPLNKITINDITEDCGVNRMTFYYHFKDIYDLVDWIIDRGRRPRSWRAAGTLIPGPRPFWTSWSRLRANKALVLNVYRSVGREQVEQYLYKLLDPMLREFVDRECQDITVQDADTPVCGGLLQVRPGGHGAGVDPPGHEGGPGRDDRAASAP